MDIRLKAKYRTATAGTYRSSHNDGRRREKRLGTPKGTGEKYIPQNHVLVLVNGRHRVWRHSKETT